MTTSSTEGGPAREPKFARRHARIADIGIALMVLGAPFVLIHELREVRAGHALDTGRTIWGFEVTHLGHIGMLVSVGLAMLVMVAAVNYETFQVWRMKRDLRRRRDLSDVAGTWVHDPAVDEALEQQRKIDPGMW